MNDTITYSDLRENLKTYLDKVCDRHSPILVKRRSGDNVVFISEEDYSSLEETAYLMRSPQNMKRLTSALKRKKNERKRYKSIKELKDEFGI